MLPEHAHESNTFTDASRITEESIFLLDMSRKLVFSPLLAQRIGLEKAIIVQQISFWTGLRKNIREGYAWVYNTYDDWAQQFPFMSKKVIRRHVLELEEMGVLISDNFNDSPYDRTKWYRIDRSSPVLYDEFPAESSTVPERAPSDEPERAPSSTEINHETTKETTRKAARTPSGNSEVRAIIDAYCKAVGIEQPTAYAKAAGQAKTLTKAGITAEDIPHIVTWLRSQTWIKNGIDLGLIVNQADKWRTANPKRQPVKPTSEMTERERIAAEIQSYRDNPHKGFGSERVKEVARLSRELAALDAQETQP